MQVEAGEGATAEGALEVFTTRPDTLHGSTYMVIAPEHPLLPALTTPDRAAAVTEYVAAAARKSDLERTELQKGKTGLFLGSHAVNPATGGRLPVYVADYVLGSYGSGAIMAVPGHDERDYEFAQEFGLPIKQVRAGGCPCTSLAPRCLSERLHGQVAARDGLWHSKECRRGCAWCCCSSGSACMLCDMQRGRRRTTRA